MVFYLRSMWQDNPVRFASRLLLGGVLGVLLTLGIEVLVFRGPGVVVRQESSQTAVVEGVRVTVPVDQRRYRAACEGGYTNRRFRHYAGGAVPAYGVHWNGQVDLLDKQIADDQAGDFAFPLFLKLPFPLPDYPDGHWFLDGEIHDNCGIFSSVISALSTSPVSLPPVPVRIIATK